MAKKKKKIYAWFYTHNKAKPDSYDMENPYWTEKDAMEEALSNLELRDTVSIWKCEIKKVGSYKQKLVKV